MQFVQLTHMNVKQTANEKKLYIPHELHKLYFKNHGDATLPLIVSPVTLDYNELILFKESLLITTNTA